MSKIYIIISDNCNSFDLNYNTLKLSLLEYFKDAPFLNIIIISDKMMTDSSSDNSMIVMPSKAEKIILSYPHIFISSISYSAINFNDCDIQENQLLNKNEINYSLNERKHKIFVEHVCLDQNKNNLFVLMSSKNNEAADFKWFNSLINIKINNRSLQISMNQIIQYQKSQIFNKTLFLKIIGLLMNQLDCTIRYSAIDLLINHMSDKSPLVFNKLPRYNCTNKISREYYQQIKEQIQSSLDNLKPDQSSTPIYIHSDAAVDWSIVIQIIYDFYGEKHPNELKTAHYKTRQNEYCHHIDVFLHYMLNLFQIKYNYSNDHEYTTLHMCSLLNDALAKHNNNDGFIRLIIIEDVDSLHSTSYWSEVCSWLPEQCSSAIRVVLLSNNGASKSSSSTSCSQIYQLSRRKYTPVFIDLTAGFASSLPMTPVNHGTRRIDRGTARGGCSAPPRQSNVQYSSLLKWCACSHKWCFYNITRLQSNPDKLFQMLSLDEIQMKVLCQILIIFAVSPKSILSINQIYSICLSSKINAPIKSQNPVESKYDLERSEKQFIQTKQDFFITDEARLSKSSIYNILEKLESLCLLVKLNCPIDCGDNNIFDFCYYQFSIGQFRSLFYNWLFEKYSHEFDWIRIQLARILTNETDQLLYYPLLIGSICQSDNQYLSIQRQMLSDWLCNPRVWLQLCLSAGNNRYCVPVELLRLWQYVLGCNTDYRPVIDRYVCYFHSSSIASNCCVQFQFDNYNIGTTTNNIFNVASLTNRIQDLLPNSFLDVSIGQLIAHCNLVLNLSRLSINFGLYPLAKDALRAILKLIGSNHNDSANHHLLASSSSSLPIGQLGGGHTQRQLKLLEAESYHLLFCCLDERLKTFEFVTEQTTHLFRRTLYYGARAIIEQKNALKLAPRSKQQNNNNNTTNNFNPIAHLGQMLTTTTTNTMACSQQYLYNQELLLAHILVHFAFALDGVENSVLNQSYNKMQVHCVIRGCIDHAWRIANKYNDSQLFLELQMTYGVVQTRDNVRAKTLLYRKPLRQALVLFGESDIFLTRIYINIGISFEEQHKYLLAYQHFLKWSQLSNELLGRGHCKSLRSNGVFHEALFQRARQFLELCNNEDISEELEREFKQSVQQNSCAHNVHSEEAEVNFTDGNESEDDDADERSWENIIHMRQMQEDTNNNWERSVSDDETPDYQQSFKILVETYIRNVSSLNESSSSSGVFKSILQYNIQDNPDLNEEERKYLLNKVLTNDTHLQTNNSNNRNDYHGLSSVTSALDESSITSSNISRYVSRLSGEISAVSRVFQEVQQRNTRSNNSNTFQLSDLEFIYRLQDLQRELQDLVNL